ncbi:MAG: hypothetical protein RB292_00615 [Patescibacteria group bacterium]|nr:hypothetical protein [Patescibacteria group bacterium]
MKQGVYRFLRRMGGASNLPSELASGKRSKGKTRLNWLEQAFVWVVSHLFRTETARRIIGEFGLH